MKWPSRRSVVHSTKGMVACTQPLAAKCGLDILNAGGNAAVSGFHLLSDVYLDKIVLMYDRTLPWPWVCLFSGQPHSIKILMTHLNPAAGLNMTEPGSTGIGGDMFCLYYDAKTGKVSALNGSGRSGANVTLESIRAALGLSPDVPDHDEGRTIPMDSVHAVTVPGAAAGWVDTVERFGSGKLTLAQILAPAIELGEKGFPVSEDSAWNVRHLTCLPS
jgi:gamma-glutamyltranspeptidase/glutathione hydrolase